VWSWRPDAGVKWCGAIRAATVANKPVHRGELGVSRKPSCRESRNVCGEPVVTTLVCFHSIAHGAAGASCARLSLRPPTEGGSMLMAKLGRKVSRECGVTSHRRRAKTSSPESRHRHSGTRESAGPESITPTAAFEHDGQPHRAPNAIAWFWIPRCAIAHLRLAPSGAPRNDSGETSAKVRALERRKAVRSAPRNVEVGPKWRARIRPYAGEPLILRAPCRY
jgi:hypothetical protein